MLPNKKYEEMERYINLEMTDEERITFELEIATSEELAKVVALYKDIPNQLQNISADLDFNRKLQAARTNFETQKLSKTNPIWWIVGVLLIGTVGYFGYQQFNTTLNTPVEESKEEELKIPEGVPIAGYLWDNEPDKVSSLRTRSGEIISDNEQKYEDAFVKYTEKDYQGSIDLLNTISEDAEVYDEALILKGVSQYDAKNTSAAIATFETYLSNDNFTKDKVLWYQALAYIKNGQNNKAKANLEMIVKEDYSKADLAKAVLERIE